MIDLKAEEQYDIMVYGPNPEQSREICRSVGLMTKAKAEENAKTLPAGYHTIGWVHGTCQSVFQFWVPIEGTAVEIPHGEKPPTGRKAAVIAARLRK